LGEEPTGESAIASGIVFAVLASHHGRRKHSSNQEHAAAGVHRLYQAHACMNMQTANLRPSNSGQRV
jgi:hypothetical protein